MILIFFVAFVESNSIFSLVAIIVLSCLYPIHISRKSKKAIFLRIKIQIIVTKAKAKTKYGNPKPIIPPNQNSFAETQGSKQPMKYKIEKKIVTNVNTSLKKPTNQDFLISQKYALVVIRFS